RFYVVVLACVRRLRGMSMHHAVLTALLRQVMSMIARDRTVSLATAAELRRARGRVPGTAGALLPVHLGAGAGDVSAGLRLVRALLPLGELPAHDALQDVLARLQPEDGIGELDLAGVLAGEGCDLEVHRHAPCVAAASSALAASLLARKAAGFGAFSGSAALTASRT